MSFNAKRVLHENHVMFMIEKTPYSLYKYLTCMQQCLQEVHIKREVDQTFVLTI